jgi:hypothetical protein
VKEQHAAFVFAALADAVLRDDGPQAHDPNLAWRARNAARISALAAADSAAAHAALARVRQAAQDPVSRALCAVLGAELPASAGTQVVRVAGHAAPITGRPLLAMLRWFSGVALVHWVWRALSFLVRVEREIEVELDGAALRLHRRTSWLGRTVRSLEAVYVLDRVSGAFRRARYGLVRSLVGVLSLSFGILLGGHLAFDAARGGAGLMLAIAACVVALGSALDLALDVLGPAARGRVHLQIDLVGARSIKVAGVTLAHADAFLEALRKALAARTA